MFHRTLVAFAAAAALGCVPFRRMLSLLAIQAAVGPSGMRYEFQRLNFRLDSTGRDPSDGGARHHCASVAS